MSDLADEIRIAGEANQRPQGPVYSEPVRLVSEGDDATFVMPTGADLSDLPALLRERGLDPDEWHVERVTVNEWDALASGGGADGEPRVVKLRQMKVNLRNRRYAIGPAAEVAQRYVPEPFESSTETRLVVVLGDQQAPYQDDDLHAAVLRWLADVQPDQAVLTGDTADFPSISRHRDKIKWNASPKQSIDGAYRLLSDYRDAEPSTTWFKLRGNHDYRVETAMLDAAPRMAFLGPAEREGHPPEPHMYSIRRLLHLDALGIELVGDEGDDWRLAEVRLAPALVVCHEPTNEKNSLRLNRSIMAGHDHRQGITSWTSYDDEGELVIRSRVGVGCLCRVKGGLGYAPKPDWQQGFATASIHPDGSQSFDLAVWRNGSLIWRGERW